MCGAALLTHQRCVPDRLYPFFNWLPRQPHTGHFISWLNVCFLMALLYHFRRFLSTHLFYLSSVVRASSRISRRSRRRSLMQMSLKLLPSPVGRHPMQLQSISYKHIHGQPKTVIFSSACYGLILLTSSENDISLCVPIKRVVLLKSCRFVGMLTL